MTDTTTPTAADNALGALIRRAFDKGRATAIAGYRARLETPTALVRAQLDVDILEGRPAWGRAARIARTVRLHPRRVARILDRLLSVSK